MGDTPTWFIYFIAFWTVVLVLFMSIGGFFMFRKFLKVLPQRDGKSKLDWQNYWVERSRDGRDGSSGRSGSVRTSTLTARSPAAAARGPPAPARPAVP